MKIVILDENTLNQGDLDWQNLRDLGETNIYERTAPQHTVERCQDAEIILTNKTLITAELITALPKLQYIGVMATGYNTVDIKAASERNIVVCNVPDYGTDAVAQHTFALILELTNHVALHNQSVKAGDWTHSLDWCYIKKPLIELKDKTLGIVGFGKIGQRTAEIAKAFGMKVIYYSPSSKETGFANYSDLEKLFATSDFISLHCTLKADNLAFVNKKLLFNMKKTAYLINTSRGALIQENDLALALNNEQIAGAALDVLSTEPPDKNNPLLTAKNCVITPHNAWMAIEARQRLVEVLAANIRAFLAGKPVNRVN